MTTKTKKKGLFTEKDKQGLAEKKGLNLGSLIDEDEELFTKEDKEGLM